MADGGDQAADPGDPAEAGNSATRDAAEDFDAESERSDALVDAISDPPEGGR